MGRFLAMAVLALVGCSGRPTGPVASSADHLLGKPTSTACDELEAPLEARAHELLSTLYIHDCCDETLLECLHQQKRCLLAVRLAENVCRRVAGGQDEEAIRLAMSLRARMVQAERLGMVSEIDLTGMEVAGDPGAPVTLVEYAGPRGVNCAQITPLVHEAVTLGPLAGKVRLFLRPFPLRSNPNSKEAGMAFLAAQELGRLWPFVLHSYRHFDDFTVEGQVAWAEAAGLDGQQFSELLEDEEIAERLVEGKMEGLDNGVDATPTFFVDGLLYMGDAEIHELVDTLGEAFDRSQGLVYEP